MSGHGKLGRVVVRGGYSIYFEDGTPIADTCVLNSDAINEELNARRIAACWNACEGIETYALELMTGDRSINRQIEAIAISNTKPANAKAVQYRRERNALFDALIVAREFVSTDRNALADTSMGPDGEMDPDDAAAVADYDAALLQIDAAIAKATASDPA